MSAADDLNRFLDTLRRQRLFEAGARVAIARAPGRLDVMGGIADYSGSLVLQRPIAEATCAAATQIDRPVIEVVSLGRLPVTVPFVTLAPGGEPVTYEAARRQFSSPDQHWAAYVVGVILVLARECGLPLTDVGLRIAISSDVPEGKGVSSSAALETAVMGAVTYLSDLAVEPRDLALLSQQAENRVAGAPCGVMDQMTSVFGVPDSLMALLCQPADLHAAVPLPEGVSLWGIDSGERHAVSGSDYASVRAAAFMGQRILSDYLGIPGGSLANLKTAECESVASLLPEVMTGADFLARYGGTVDSATTVAPERQYPVRAATMHPVYERSRAETFRESLLNWRGDESGVTLGRLMYESHASYGRCGLGSRGTDRLVELVKASGCVSGLYGARITGGGSGGTVAVVGRSDASQAIARIVEQYERDNNYRPYVFGGSSPGLVAFGPRAVNL